MSIHSFRPWSFALAAVVFAAASTVMFWPAALPAAEPAPVPTHLLYDDPAKVQCTGSDPIVWVNIGVAYYLSGSAGYSARVGTGGFACKSVIIGLGLGYLEGSQALTKDPWPAACAAADPVVWGNKTSGIYYLSATPGYIAKIGSGGFACKSDLDKAAWLNGATALTKDPWPGACASGDPIVWVNKSELAYYLPGSPGYNAKVGSGGYICKADAVRDGAFDGDGYRTTKAPWPAACVPGDPVVWVSFQPSVDYIVAYYLPDTPGYNAKAGNGGYKCRSNLLRWFPNATQLTAIPTPRPSATLDPNGGNTWSATAVRFRGQNGSHHVYTCPAHGFFYPIIGTFSYADESSVCTAAVHDGWITRVAGGTVTIEIRPGGVEYFGMSQNGVRSQRSGPKPGGFVFVRS